MAVIRGMQGCRHGGDRRVLEAGLAHPRRRRLRAGAGQRRACEERAGPQERRERRRLAGRPSCPWAHPRELRAGCPDAGVARPVADPQAAGAGEEQPCPAVQRTLEDANIKLDSAISDVTGLSGRAMIEALIAGETDPGKLAALAHPRLKASPVALREALRGRVTRHHRFLLQLHLRQIDALNGAIREIDREVDEGTGPFRAALGILSSIPGVGQLGAQVISAEIGIDMSRFPTAGHLISWAGLCPKSDESAGKRRSTRMRKGAPWLKTTLIQCAWAASRKKGSY